MVEENNLNKNISVLRQLLGEKRGEHRFIATVPGKGYRFVASVVECSGSGVPRVTEVPSDGAPMRLSPSLIHKPSELVAGSSFPYRNWLLAALTVTFIVTGSYLSRGRGSPRLGAVQAEADKHSFSSYALDPGDTEAQLFLAHFYSTRAKHDMAVPLEEGARHLDPLTINRHALAGQFLYYAGRYDEAIVSLQQAIELHPYHWLPRIFLARSYIEKEMFREAIVSCQEAKRLGSSSLELIALEGWSYAKLGETGKAYAALKELEQISKHKYVPSYFAALIHNALGEKEVALSLLEEGAAARDVRMAFLHVDPKWNNLRNEPRFIAIMKTMKYE